MVRSNGEAYSSDSLAYFPHGWLDFFPLKLTFVNIMALKGICRVVTLQFF